MSDPNDAQYKESLKKVSESFNYLKDQLIISTQKSENVFSKLGTIENVLETLLNWIKIEKDWPC